MKNIRYRLAFPVMAVSAWLTANAQEKVQGPQTAEDVFRIITKIFNWILAAAIILGIVYIILAGIAYMRSGGNPEALKTAQKKLIYAIIGIAIVLAAKGIVALVANFLGVSF